LRKAAAFLTTVCLGCVVYAQDIAPTPSAKLASAPANSVSDSQNAPVNTTREKWNHFLRETASPLTLGGGAFNAAFSQIIKTDPKYGVNSAAFAERFGASVVDIATQNFFGDFLVASALHQDPRYYRKGEGHCFWSRAGYAVSRAMVIRKDSGGNTFNYDNVFGSALSSGLSNLYYPQASRGAKATLMHFGIDVADYGLVNLAPEFWPDFRAKVLRRHR
jgi:hypothetical protein